MTQSITAPIPSAIATSNEGWEIAFGTSSLNCLCALIYGCRHQVVEDLSFEKGVGHRPEDLSLSKVSFPDRVSVPDVPSMLDCEKQVVAQYGDNSDQVQAFGLKKKSEYKRPPGRAAAAAGVAKG